MLKILELFGGIGACSKAIERLGIDYEIVDYVEIDKYAVKSFNAMHNTNFEPQDICTWNKNIEVDLIMHGSPCQDFSLAGKQAGGDKNSGTRSSLMYETIRIVEKLKPKYVIWENVKNLISKKHKHNFDAYLDAMKQLGYVNYYQVLNSKDYGIPQNRERVFTISILGNDNYEFPQGNLCNNEIKVVGNYMPSGHDASRIVDENGLAPTVKENHGTVTAVLQHSEQPKNEQNKINRLYGLYGQATRWGVYDKDGISPTITASMGMGGGHVPMVEEFEFPKPQSLDTIPLDYIEENADKKYDLTEKTLNHYQREFGSKGKEIDLTQPIPTLTASMGTGGGNIPYFQFPPKRSLELKLKDMLEDKVDEKFYLSESKIQKIANWKAYQKPFEKVQGKNSIVPTLTARGAGEEHSGMITYSENLEDTTNLQEECLKIGLFDDTSSDNFANGKRDYGYRDEYGTLKCSPKYSIYKNTDLRIRKLTPKECWRLMGFNDEDYEKASQVNSNTQLYKQAGNSIVVNVLEAIFKNLLVEYINAN